MNNKTAEKREKDEMYKAKPINPDSKEKIIILASDNFFNKTFYIFFAATLLSKNFSLT